MKLADFLSDHLHQVLLHCVGMAALTVFLLATGTAWGIVVLILIVWALGLLAVLGVGYARASARLQQLDALMQGLDRKYLFAECAPSPRSQYERHWQGLMRRSSKAMIEAVSDAEAQQRDYREYIENWVHEIKAPITSAQLMCRNDASPLGQKLGPPLAQIEEHVERALYYARAGSVDHDFVITETPLTEAVAPAIARHKALLIQNGIRVETEGLDERVYTDAKWVTFIVGQLLANAARYHGNAPVIRITAKRLGRLVQLSIWDNGIGIPAHDLPRIFAQGFTGSNGRKAGTATGMGLYIAKRLAAQLQIELAANSTEGEFTEITLLFPAKENLSTL